MQKPSPSINLLRTQEKDFLTRFFEWAMVGGRFIIIVTESIALMMFLYRFSLDQELVDLHQSIKDRGAILEGFKTQEDTYRDLQNRLALAKKYVTNGQETQKIMTNVITAGKGFVTFSQLQFNGRSIQLKASSTKASSLDAFINKVKLLPDVQAVHVSTIDNMSSTGTISLSLTVDIKI